MKARFPFRLAAAAGLWISALGVAQEPNRIPSETTQAAVSADQRLADAVADRLAQTPDLDGMRAEITVVNGAVQLSGSVAHDAQRDAAVRAVQGIQGVRQIRFSLPVAQDVAPVSGEGPTAPAPGMLNTPAPVTGGIGGLISGAPGAIDPTPLNGGFAGGMNLNPPSMPPYAWPTYAPYNNYSRVAYPEEYPYASFPYIGPMYPFPKVPLGYRAVKLEWENGHWWYGRTNTKRDYWKVRYW